MNILYAISTKSNLERKTFCVKIAVDLFVRSWVEIINPATIVFSIVVDLFVRSWVEILLLQQFPHQFWSTSSWGRELKCFEQGSRKVTVTVDLFVRSWVEIYQMSTLLLRLQVDLFVRSWVEITRIFRQKQKLWSRPLREVVSWNDSTPEYVTSCTSRPLREVVSWNIALVRAEPHTKGRPLREVVSWNAKLSCACWDKWVVDLFVRSWVEMSVQNQLCLRHPCRPLREVVSWNTIYGLVTTA